MMSGILSLIAVRLGAFFRRWLSCSVVFGFSELMIMRQPFGLGSRSCNCHGSRGGREGIPASDCTKEEAERIMKRRSLFRSARERTLRSFSEVALTMQVEPSGSSASLAVMSPERRSARERD